MNDKLEVLFCTIMHVHTLSKPWADIGEMTNIILEVYKGSQLQHQITPDEDTRLETVMDTRGGGQGGHKLPPPQ